MNLYPNIKMNNMKKISTLLVSLFFVVTVFAQTPVITNLYEFSVIKGNKPAWIHDISERNMAYYNGKIET